MHVFMEKALCKMHISQFNVCYLQLYHVYVKYSFHQILIILALFLSKKNCYHEYVFPVINLFRHSIKQQLAEKIVHSQVS